MTPKLSIIIVSYNTSKLTCQTVQSVFADLKASELNGHADVWVVDNASSDDSLAELKKQFASHLAAGAKLPLEVIKMDHNAGFSAANNVAIQKSQGQVVLLLNSDTVVCLGSLQKIVDAFAVPVHPETAFLAGGPRLDNLGILAASLVNPDDSPQWQGGSFPSLPSLTVHWLMLDDIPVLGKFLPSTQHTGLNAQRLRQSADQATQNLLQMEWVGGTAMAIRRQVFDEVGLLDEQIFMYGEDMEFCLRAVDHHWDVALLLDAKITHLGSASSSSANAILGEIKGYLYIWSKHKPVWQLEIAKFILRVGCALRMTLFSLVGNRQKASIYHQALSSVLR